MTGKRTLVIGLDGVPYSLLRQLITDGIMPNMAELCEGGTFSPMKVTLPEISMVSWTSFMTGKNPGGHGIFGFTELNPQTYQLRFPSFSDLKAKPLWEELGQEGRKSLVINQPATYPARPMNGALISGFVAIDLQKSVFPSMYLPALKQAGYLLDIDSNRARKDTEYLFHALHESFLGRVAARDILWDKIDWEYCEIVITGTDRLFHVLWDAVVEKNHPYHGKAMDYFRNLDRFIGGTFAKYRTISGRDNPREGFFLLSDHGFCGIRQEVYLNAWLREAGYLDYRTDNPSGIEDITDKTRAFVLDPGRLYLHRKERYTRGCVTEEDVPALKTEIMEGLRGLTFKGEPVLETVRDARNFYSGPFVEEGPDLILTGKRGFDLKGSPREKRIFTRTDLQGMHTWNDAFFWSAEVPKSEVYITDLYGILRKSLE